MKTNTMLGRRLPWGAALLALATLFLAGCSTLGSHPPAPASVQEQEHRYKIGPLDTLNIQVWRNPELSATVTVRPDGRISSPLVEDLVAAGKSPVELSREIEKALSRVIRDPAVTVIVSGFQGTFGEQIRIVGEAARPQAVPYRQNMTVLDVMIQVGGMTDFADGNAAVLVRGAEGGKQYGIRLKDLLKRGDISANVGVRPGDIIIVPQSWF
ncbi:MAG TPA: polysaccharide export protein [Azospira sp.]|uniref:XrtA/PEP-CTERM system exopolysaccharide export protein n=1 Tax=Piscinibacter sp. TaxID=1903157 RepID=UPI002BF1848F|nr:polysaccharide export protein [Azospira sp.]